MKTLIIVDFQKDFANKTGSLYVNGAEQAEQNIVDYINKHANELSDVIFTVDWHSPEHCSFKKNGGTWPLHCLQFSEGAGISDNIMKTCLKHNLDIKILVKGNLNNTEEYGAFNYINKTGDGNYVLSNLYYEKYEVGTFSNNNSVLLITNEVVVCGIAGDYCVKSTIENLLNHKDECGFNIEVLKSGIVSIDGGEILDNFIKENNLKVVE